MDMNVFSKNIWNKKSTDKKQALQDLENHYAAQQGRKPGILSFVDSKHAGDFNISDNTLMIDEKMLVNGDSFKRYQVIDTVIHEGRHSYQYYAINHPGTHPNQEEEDKWRENDLGYIEADSPDLYKYRFQSQERDAYDYAASEMGKIFKNMPGEEHIYSQYEQIMNDYTKGFEVDAEANLGKDYIQKIDAEVAEKARMLKDLKNKSKAAARVANAKSPSPAAKAVSPEAITYDKIKIESPWEILSIHEILITKTLNQHAKLHITALLTEEAGKKAGLEETVGQQVKLYTEDGNDKKYIFKGLLQQVSLHQDGGLYTITASFFSQTSMLDSQEKSRSFQDTSLTYNDIVTKILADYPGKDFELTAEKTPINGPLIQYQETDWQFIKRIASYQETVLVPDAILDEIVFSFGYPAGGVKTLPEGIDYRSGKDIAAYNTDWAYNPELIANEYSYYEVEAYEELTIGDQVTFLGYEMYVGAVTIELKNGILVYHAKLVRQMTLRKNPIYNEKIQGVSLEGKVLALQDQEIKLHLAIDQEQDEATAYWYPFVPPTTDMMYLMPQLGTNSSLYTPGLMEQNAIITGSVRNNGASCEKTGDPNTRFLGTEYGQELKLAPGGIYITAGISNLVANFDDEEGVKLSSHKKLILEAEQEIIIESQSKVSFSGASQVLMATPSAAISLENETHFLADQTHITCTDEAPFPEVDQPEQAEEQHEEAPPAEESEQGSGVDISSIVASAKGAIAVIGDFLGGVGAGIVNDSASCDGRSGAYKTGYEMTTSFLRSATAVAAALLVIAPMISDLSGRGKSGGGDNPALAMVSTVSVIAMAGALILKKTVDSLQFDFSRLFASKSEGSSNAAGFEKDISNLSAGERVAKVKTEAAKVAEQNGWERSSKLSKFNKRDIYKDEQTGDTYSVDTQHGRFEKCNSKGKHQGEFDFDLNQTKPADKSGGHDIKVK